VRRSKLYYLRELVGKAARLKEKRIAQVPTSGRAKTGPAGGRALPLRERRVATGHLPPRGGGRGGAGPLAGPVVAAAVVLAPGARIAGVDDSKRLLPERAAAALRSDPGAAVGVGVGIVDHLTIDRINILQATRLAMGQALGALGMEPELVLTDFVTVPGLRCPQRNLVEGDRRSASVAAASIIAKVTRDRIMEEADRAYPLYGFGRHKGYGTPEHRSRSSSTGRARYTAARSRGSGTSWRCFHVASFNGSRLIKGVVATCQRHTQDHRDQGGGRSGPFPRPEWARHRGPQREDPRGGDRSRGEGGQDPRLRRGQDAPGGRGGSPAGRREYPQAEPASKLAHGYLKLKRLRQVSCRFDVVSVIFNDEGAVKAIRHIPNAFSVSAW